MSKIFPLETFKKTELVSVFKKGFIHLKTKFLFILSLKIFIISDVVGWFDEKFYVGVESNAYRFQIVTPGTAQNVCKQVLIFYFWKIVCGSKLIVILRENLLWAFHFWVFKISIILLKNKVENDFQMYVM